MNSDIASFHVTVDINSLTINRLETFPIHDTQSRLDAYFEILKESVKQEIEKVIRTIDNPEPAKEEPRGPNLKVLK